MAGLICLQGGAEFQPGCEAMDLAVLDGVAAGLVGDRGRSGAPGSTAVEARRAAVRVLVAPFAGRPGREREVAYANAERWYLGLGATDVRPAFDSGPALVTAMDEADLLVLPGGSPTRLLEALRPHAEALRGAVSAGLAISGASAGAMVLCRWTVLPEAYVHVVEGLAVADVDLVLPHYRGSTAWLDGARDVLPRDGVVLGLPERSGVLLDPSSGDRGEPRAVGAQAVTRIVLP